MKLRGGKSAPALLTACSAVAIFAASGSAMAAPPPNCPTQTGAGPGFIPLQTIKIFNDSAQQGSVTPTVADLYFAGKMADGDIVRSPPIPA